MNPNKRIVNTVLNILLCIMLCLMLWSCDQVKVPENTETQDAHHSIETDTSVHDDIPASEEAASKDRFGHDYIMLEDRYGYGLLNTGIFRMIDEEPDFSSGVVLSDAYLYPAPSETIYELGLLYQGTKVNILYKVDIMTFDEYDQRAKHEDWSWYLVETKGISTFGFVRSDCIGNADTMTVESTAPYMIPMGSEYYYDNQCEEPHVAEGDIAPLYLKKIDEETGVCFLEGLSGFQCYVPNIEALERSVYLGNGRVGHGS